MMLFDDVQLEALEVEKNSFTARYSQDAQLVNDYVKQMMDTAPKKYGHARWAFRGAMPNCEIHSEMIEFQRATGAIPGMPKYNQEFTKWCVRRLHSERKYAACRGHRW